MGEVCTAGFKKSDGIPPEPTVHDRVDENIHEWITVGQPDKHKPEIQKWTLWMSGHIPT